MEASKTISSFLDYENQAWMTGRDRLEAMQDKLRDLQKVLAAVEHFERKAARAFLDSQEPSILGFDYHNHKYEICKAACERLKQKYNHDLIETTF